MTEEQYKQLWEAVGFKLKILQNEVGSIYGMVCFRPDSKRCNDFPNPDFNNFSKWIRPKLITTDGYTLELLYTISHCEAHMRPHYFGDKHYSATSNKDKPEVALYELAWEVLCK